MELGTALFLAVILWAGDLHPLFPARRTELLGIAAIVMVVSFVPFALFEATPRRCACFSWGPPSFTPLWPLQHRASSWPERRCGSPRRTMS